MSHPRRVVVTGGAGFIGSHLVERLLGDGCHVTVLDDFSTGREANLAALRRHAALAVHTVDVAEHARVVPLVAGAEWVFHLAALADIVPSVERPLAYHRANVDGTASVVEAARKAGVRRFVYAASSSCYGIPDVYPTPESAAIRPQYPYALTKRLGEEIVLHWAQVYGLPAVSLRFFNVFGPRARTSGTYGAVFGVFLAQKLAGRPFTVVGDGTQTRDFTFVTDVVDALVAAAASDVTGEVLNVGSGTPHSVNRLIALLGGGEVTHLPVRPGEPACTHADTTRIAQRLGWRPRTSFEAGVHTMLDNIDYWREAPVWTPESIAKATQDWFTFLRPSSPSLH
ncbi:MAG: NAD-dependent epimerase/dehydratase family protein [Candidatus Binatia bacterium]